MRKYIVNPVIALTLAVFLLFVSSCEKKVEINEADLIGVWDMGPTSVDVKVGPVSMLQFLKTTLQMSDQQAQEFVDHMVAEFQINDGVVRFSEDYSYEMVKWDLGEEGTWELESDQLYLTVTGESQSFPVTIESLNSTAGLVVWEEEHEVNISVEGTPHSFTATIIMEVNLTKQL